MHNAIKALLVILGALGWGILGGMLMYLEIGPWWFGWVPLTASVCVIACALDSAMSPGKGW